MRYRLNPEYTLQGWTNKPHCAVNERTKIVRVISAKEILFLMECDGVTECAPETDEMGRFFMGKGAISSVEPTEDQPAEALDIAYTLHDYLLRDIAQVAITGRCNLHCRHCLAAADENNVSTQLSLEDCRKIFAEMIECHIYRLWLTGGEPMSHPQFREIFMAACEFGLHITQIFTNAWLVTPEILDFIRESGQKPLFVVSFDGLGTHDWMRCCEGAEQRTLDTIRMIHEAGFAVRASVNVNAVTAPRIIETCRTLVRDYHVSSLHPIYTSPTPRWQKLANESDLLDVGEYYDLMIELLRVSRVEKWDVPVDVIHLPHVHLDRRGDAVGYLHTPPEPRDSRKLMNSCGRASSVVFIASDGRVLPCSTYEGETVKIGAFQGADINVLERPLREILRDSEYSREFDWTVADLREREEGCRDCKWAGICCGGCPIYVRSRKYWDCGNPICEFYRGGYATKYVEMLEATM